VISVMWARTDLPLLESEQADVTISTIFACSPLIEGTICGSLPRLFWMPISTGEEYDNSNSGIPVSFKAFCPDAHMLKSEYLRQFLRR